MNNAVAVEAYYNRLNSLKPGTDAKYIGPDDGSTGLQHGEIVAILDRRFVKTYYMALIERQVELGCKTVLVPPMELEPLPQGM